MADTSHQPTLNMGAVSRETGLSEHTLRAWERRYGLPRPHRTPGGHRLYTRHDVDLLKWLLAQQRAGVSISRAIERWRYLEQAGQSPLSPAADPARPAPATPLQALRADWLRACLAFDERGAEAVLTEAFALYPTEVVCGEVLQASLADVGEGWFAGRISVQQEHFASALAIRRLEAIIVGAPPPTRAGRLLIGCAPGDDHIFAPLLLTVMLRRHGWDVVFLGANVPVEGLDATMASTRPDLLVLSAERLPMVPALIEAAHVARQRGIALGYGGRIFNRLPALRQRIPAHFLGQSLAEAVRTIEHLIARPGPMPVAAPEADLAARHHLAERRPLIEMRLARELAGEEALRPHLAMANAFLADHVTAALTLGDIGMIDDDLAWLGGLLERRGLPPEVFRAYLATYHRVVTAELDELMRPRLQGLREWTGDVR